MHLQVNLLTHKREKEREKKKTTYSRKEIWVRWASSVSVPSCDRISCHITHKQEVPFDHLRRKHSPRLSGISSAKKSNNNMTAVLSDVAMIQHACKRRFLSSFLVSRIHHQELSSAFSTQKSLCKNMGVLWACKLRNRTTGTHSSKEPGQNDTQRDCRTRQGNDTRCISNFQSKKPLVDF